MMHTVWPVSTMSPSLTNGGASGLAARKNVPTIGAVTGTRWSPDTVGADGAGWAGGEATATGFPAGCETTARTPPGTFFTEIFSVGDSTSSPATSGDSLAIRITARIWSRSSFCSVTTASRIYSIHSICAINAAFTRPPPAVAEIEKTAQNALIVQECGPYAGTSCNAGQGGLRWAPHAMPAGVARAPRAPRQMLRRDRGGRLRMARAVPHRPPPTSVNPAPSV